LEIADVLAIKILNRSSEGRHEIVMADEICRLT
jgi:hypothetical protein